MVYNGTRLRFVKLYRNGKLQLAHSLNGRNEFRARGAGGINDAVVIRIVGLGQALGTEPQSVTAVDIPAFTCVCNKLSVSLVILQAIRINSISSCDLTLIIIYPLKLL